jgi:3-deoxy-D-manno-octulosonic-acid transferase
MHLIYTIFIHLYAVLIYIASFFNSKAKLWIDGRENIFQTINSKLTTHNLEFPIVWFHCASLGEFEQGRTLMEKFKIQNSKIKIFLTFFSPSGYEIQKNYKGADYIFYLPVDTPSNAKQFIELIKPKAVFFIKYEFWFNYLNELKKHNIPTYLVSGIFRKNHYFFKFYGAWFRKQLKCFTHFYLQTVQSEQLLKTIGYTNTTVSGDTRFDRVFEISKNVKLFPLIEQFKQGKNIFIAGSTWAEDEIIIATLNFKTLNFKLIIAPHEINESHLQSIEKLYNMQCLRYSKANEKNIATTDVLIIDNIGMLSSLYQYGSIAYIGGGFGKGIHNILEASTFGMPVIFGPNYQKFSEAIDLIQLGGAFSISSKEELENIFLSLNNPDGLKNKSLISKNYVASRIGATAKILNSITIK